MVCFLAPLLILVSCHKSDNASSSSTSDDTPQRLQVTVGGKVGYVDRSGKIQINPQYDSAQSFSEGLAVVCIGECDSDHLMGRRYTKDFQEEKLEQNYKYGFVDESGKLVINPIYEGASAFSEGLAAVCVGKGCYWGVQNEDKEKKWGFIDHSGNMVIPPQFESASNFKEGLAPVSVGGKYGFIDKHGQFVVNPSYDSALEFDHGLAPVAIKDKDKSEGKLLGVWKWGYIDKTGRVIWEPSD